MKTGRILKVERIKEITLPPGEYLGTWSGYQITIKMDNGKVFITTESGIRGWINCVVKVDEAGNISVENETSAGTDASGKML